MFRMEGKPDDKCCCHRRKDDKRNEAGGLPEYVMGYIGREILSRFPQRSGYLHDYDDQFRGREKAECNHSQEYKAYHNLLRY